MGYLFKAHYDVMRPGPTPERVRAICKLLSGTELTENEIKDYIYLDKTVTTKIGEEFKRSLQASVELGLVAYKDSRYTLAVDESQVHTVETFRRTVARCAFANRDSTFFRVSRWYMNANETVFDEIVWEKKANMVKKALGDDRINENDMLGWRFWASFLGLGYLSGTELIPNMYLRVRDVLAVEFSKVFAFGEEVPAHDFFAWLWELIPEARTEDESINLALSNAIRTLRDMGEVKPVFFPDAVPMYLYSLPEDSTKMITHVIVRKEVCE